MMRITVNRKHVNDYTQAKSFAFPHIESYDIDYKTRALWMCNELKQIHIMFLDVGDDITITQE